MVYNTDFSLVSDMDYFGMFTLDKCDVHLLALHVSLHATCFNFIKKEQIFTQFDIGSFTKKCVDTLQVG